MTAVLPAISGCGDGRAGGSPAAAATSTSPVPAGTQADESSAEDQPADNAASNAQQPAVARAVPSGRARDITFDAIKFPMDKKDTFKRSMLTAEIEALKGQKVRIRGYILPTSTQQVSQFVLVRDNKECCFGPGAALYDCVAVEMDPGESTEYSLFPVAVEGVFDVQILPGPDDRPWAIYHLQASSVK